MGITGLDTEGLYKEASMNTVFELKSTNSLAVTIENVKKELAARKFGVLWELNFKSKFEEKGYEYPYDFWILEVCNPGIAIGVLESNQSAGYFLPCKVAIFDSEDGVKVGLVKPTDLIGLISDNLQLIERANEVESILTESLKASV